MLMVSKRSGVRPRGEAGEEVARPVFLMVSLEKAEQRINRTE